MARVICVLGMHRSGTSLVARLLNLLGVDLGPADTLRRPDQFNPTGFWEQEQFIAFNDEILRRLGGTWRELPRRVAGWERPPQFDDLFDEASRFIRKTFAGAAYWGWKDPRTCVTLPFWQRVVPDLTYIICLRNPADVAHSLEHTMPFRMAGRLWHSYVASSLMHTTGRERLCVFYEDCLDRLDEPLKRLADFLDLTAHLDDAKSQAQAAGFVDVQREHHRTSPVGVIQERRLSFASKALYAALRLSTPGAANGAATPLFLRETVDALAYRSLEAHHLHLANRATIRQQAVQIQNAERALRQRDADLARQRTSDEQHLANERAAREKLAAEHQRADFQRRAELAAIHAELERQQRVVRRLRRRLRTTSQQTDRDLQERLVSLAETLQARHRRRDVRKSLRRSKPTPISAPLDYPTLVERIQEVAKAKLPAGAKVLVVSKGDEEILRLDPAVGRHFPYDAMGEYAGFHPQHSEAAILALETARSEGAEFLVFPQTALWWLNHYRQFNEHLNKCYRQHLEVPGVCLIYELRSARSGSSSRPRGLAAWPTPAAHKGPAHFTLSDQVGELVRALLPEGASVLMASRGDDELCQCCDAKHFPQDEHGEYASERRLDSAAAIAHLDDLAAAGAQYLVVPRSAFNWLEQDSLFARHLRANHRQITLQRNVCAIFALNAPKRVSPRATIRNGRPPAASKPARRAAKPPARQKG